MHKICSLYIDNEPFQFKVEGDFFWGKPELLYPKDDNVLSKMEWEPQGFNVVKAFEGDEFTRLQNSIRAIIVEALKANDVNVDASTFKLKDYHKYVTTSELHNSVINITKNLEVSDFDFDIDLLAKRFGDILGYELTSWVEELQKSHIQIDH